MAKSMKMLSQSLQQPQQQYENDEDQRETYKFTLIVIQTKVTVFMNVDHGTGMHYQ